MAGDGFLWNMVRTFAGTLVEVGKGAIFPEQIPEILAARDRRVAGPTAPPQGLSLIQIFYDEDPKVVTSCAAESGGVIVG